MADTPTPPNTPEGRFLYRIERRAAFLKTLLGADFGIYQSSDADKRKRAIEHLVRMIARQSELPHLKPETLRKATEMISEQLEAMQRVLPHDVQYRNRMRQNW
ncbi:MAG: hypothetical protein RBT55_03895 [Rhodocyclaceae bacterium]|jgi:hypothetical protein|nr:hypothetical protein [Rhodocyclaceae bacterium]